jgi:hypothetical protein
MARDGEVGCAGWKRCRRAAALFLTLFLSTGPLPAQTQDALKAAEQAIRRLDLQTELPREAEPASIPFRPSLPPEIAWLLAAIGIGLLLYMFRDMLPALGFAARGGWTAEEETAAEASAKAPEKVLAAADDLAGQGRFVDAMHVLLMQGLFDIRQHLDEEFSDSLTSREILRSTKLSERGRHSLRDIVSRVEWTYFGEHPADASDYAACRASFDALSHALRAGAAA